MRSPTLLPLKRSPGFILMNYLRAGETHEKKRLVLSMLCTLEPHPWLEKDCNVKMVRAYSKQKLRGIRKLI